MLMQPTPNRMTRTFMDYSSIGQAMEGKSILEICIARNACYSNK